MKYPESNMLVVRKTYRTLKDSCFTELKWAMKRLKVEHLWQVKESPLEMTYIPTGQKIYFRGLDDPLKITSIAVEVGVLCWMWIEEAYEITSEADFDTLAEYKNDIKNKMKEDAELRAEHAYEDALVDAINTACSTSLDIDDIIATLTPEPEPEPEPEPQEPLGE